MMLTLSPRQSHALIANNRDIGRVMVLGNSGPTTVWKATKDTTRGFSFDGDSMVMAAAE